MALKIKEFDVNKVTAVSDGTFAYIRYGDSDRTEQGMPQIIVYGGLRINENYFEIDIKDDATEDFFISLEETMLRVSGGCLGVKPWKIKSPLINYRGSYTVGCKILPSSSLGRLEGFGMCRRRWCEITPYFAFAGANINGIVIMLNKVCE